MNWLTLILAGLLETFWAYQLKCSLGFTRLLPSVLTLIGMAASFYLLSLSLKSLPLGTAYAVWTGVGTVGTALVGIFLLKEPFGTLRLLSILLIVAGIVGLNLATVK